MYDFLHEPRLNLYGAIMNVSRITVILVTIFWLLLVEFGFAIADELDKQQKALNIINEFADKVCGEIPDWGASSKVELGGKVNVELPKFIKKLVDIGVEGVAKYQTSKHSGILQSDLAKVLKDRRDCKVKVTELLIDKLISGGRTSTREKHSQRCGLTGENIRTCIPDKDIPQAGLSGLLTLDSDYKRARSYLAAKEYEKAANIFLRIYKIKPDYPTLAIYYGETLANLKKNDEALAVWLSVPQTEKHSFTNLNIGILLYRLKRYEDAFNYFKLAEKDFRRNDCRYWTARVLQILSEKDNLSTKQLIDRVNEFVEIVDNDVRNLTKYEVKKGTKYEIDRCQVENDVLSRKSAAFHLLRIVSKKLSCEENSFDESLLFSLRAADQLAGRTCGCPIIMNKPHYISFLEDISFLICHAKEKETYLSMVDSTMEKIVKYNDKTADQEIADFAMLIRSFYGSTNTIRSVKKGKFKIAYGLTCTDEDSGVGYIDIMSPKYLAGMKKIKVSGQKEYRFEEAFIIGPKTVLGEKPYLDIACIDMAGNKTTTSLFPVIKIIK